MPKQEVFFEQYDGSRRIEVLKSYNQGFAGEAFKSMDEAALKRLWTTLKPEKIYDPDGLPSLNDPSDVNGEAEALFGTSCWSRRARTAICCLSSS